MPMEYFEQRERALLGDRFDVLYAAPQETAERGVTVSALRSSPEQFAAKADFPLEASPFCKAAFVVHQPDDLKFRPGRHPYHHAGVFYSQEPSASSAAPLLGVQPGMRVLDMCAAPGGKSSQLAAALQGRGVLVSNEYVAARADILKSNLERMGVPNAVVLNETPARIADVLPEFFDRVLVDAPCSGEGMFRKEPVARQQHCEALVKQCAELGAEILDCAAAVLAPGGQLVYSTCTFSVEENEGVITRFISENPDFELEDSDVNFGRPTLNYARRIFPMDGGEGHFAARLRKKGENVKTKIPDVSSGKVDKEILDFYDSLFYNRPFGDNIKVVKDKIIILPKKYNFDTKGLSVLRAGVILGEILKNRIEPHHSAFTSAKKEDCRNVVDFDVKSNEIKAFLHGEEVSVSDNVKGFTAVCVNGMTTGFGKASNGRLKNKYPKGLRILR